MASGWWHGASGADWSNTVNWYALADGSTGNVAVPPGAGDTANLTATGFSGPYDIYIAADTTVGTVSINGSNTDGITLKSGTLSTPPSVKPYLSVQTAITKASGSGRAVLGVVTDSLYLGLKAASTALAVSNASSTDLVLPGITSVSGATVVTFSATGTGDIDVAAAMSSLSGTIRATVNSSGTGAVVLRGAGPNGGTFTLTTGYVQVGSALSLGTATMSMTVGAGSKISSIDSTAVTLSVGSTSGSLVISGSATFGDVTKNGALTFSVPVTVTGGPTLTTDSPLTLTGTVSGAFTKAGSSVLSLTNPSNGALEPTISAGTVRVGGGTFANQVLGTTSLTMSGGRLSSIDTNEVWLSALPAFVVLGDIALGSTTFTGKLTFGSGVFANLSGATRTVTVDSEVSGLRFTNGGLIKSGVGRLYVFESSNHADGTTVAEGTLEVGGPDVLPANGNVTITGGELKIQSSQNNLAAVVISGGAVNRSTTGTANLRARTHTINNSTGTVVIDAGLSNATGYSATFTKSGAGVVQLLQVCPFTGVATLADGVVELVSPEFAPIGPLGNNAKIRFTNGTLRYTATNTYDYSARFDPTVFQYIKIDTNGQDIVFATAITGSATFLNKYGAGTLTLTAANTFGDSISIFDGSVCVGAADAVPAGIDINLSLSASGSPRLSSDGATARVLTFAELFLSTSAALGDASRSGALTLNADVRGFSPGLTLSIDSPVEITGQLRDLPFIKSGAATLTLSGDSSATMTQPMTVVMGTLIAAATGAVSGVASVSAGATVRATATNSINGAASCGQGTVIAEVTSPFLGAVEVPSGGVLQTTTANGGKLTLSGKLTIDGGKLRFGG